MSAIRPNSVIEIYVLPHRSAKFAFSPENSPKPTNKKLLQQARLIAGLRGLQTPLVHPVKVAAARLGTVFVIASTQGVAHSRRKALRDEQWRHRSHNFTGT